MAQLTPQAFRKWHAAIRSLLFEKRQRALSRSLLMLSPTFGPALLSIRRMTLAATHDPAGSWKRRALPDGAVTWLHSNPDLYTPKGGDGAGPGAGDDPADDEDGADAAHGAPLGDALITRMSMLAAAPPTIKSHASGSLGVAGGPGGGGLEKQGSSRQGGPPSRRGSFQGVTSGAPPDSKGGGASARNSSGGGGVQGQQVAGAPSLMRVSDMEQAMARGGGWAGKREGSLRRKPRGRSDSTSGATVAPEHSLLLPREELPQGGLAVQLGTISSNLLELCTLEQFKQQRAQAKVRRGH